MSSADENYVKIATVHGPIEENQVASFLRANDVPVRIRGEAIRRIHGITVDGIGAADVEVPARFERAARDLLAQVERGELALPEEFDGDADDTEDPSDPAATTS
jgi:hypothetical protein